MASSFAEADFTGAALRGHELRWLSNRHGDILESLRPALAEEAFDPPPAFEADFHAPGFSPSVLSDPDHDPQGAGPPRHVVPRSLSALRDVGGFLQGGRPANL